MQKIEENNEASKNLQLHRHNKERVAAVPSDADYECAGC